jgi:hypothetical protein
LRVVEVAGLFQVVAVVLVVIALPLEQVVEEPALSRLLIWQSLPITPLLSAVGALEQLLMDNAEEQVVTRFLARLLQMEGAVEAIATPSSRRLRGVQVAVGDMIKLEPLQVELEQLIKATLVEPQQAQ